MKAKFMGFKYYNMKLFLKSEHHILKTQFFGKSFNMHLSRIQIQNFPGLKLTLPLVIILVTLLPSNGEDWCYEGNCGPRTWTGTCKFGTSQSPVNILPNKTVKVKPPVKNLTFSKSYYYPQNFEIVNNGHTVMLSLVPPKSGQAAPLLQVEGNGWKGAYNFLQMHFHWGSEHLLKNKRFPLELHIVHEQANGNGGLGVLGILYGTSNTASKVLQPIIDMLPKVHAVSVTPVPVTKQITLSTMLPTVFDVFRYEGSLTTPPCTEKILWSVFTQRMPVSSAQVSSFSTIVDSHGNAITKNYRPIKPLVTKTRKNIFWMPINKDKTMANAF